jgi:hypothetical protein
MAPTGPTTMARSPRQAVRKTCSNGRSLPLPRGVARGSGERRNTLGDHVDADDREEHRHHRRVVRDEPALERVELGLRLHASDQIVGHGKPRSSGWRRRRRRSASRPRRRSRGQAERARRRRRWQAAGSSGSRPQGARRARAPSRGRARRHPPSTSASAARRLASAGCGRCAPPGEGRALRFPRRPCPRLFRDASSVGRLVQRGLAASALVGSFRGPIQPLRSPRATVVDIAARFRRATGDARRPVLSFPSRGCPGQPPRASGADEAPSRPRVFPQA